MMINIDINQRSNDRLTETGDMFLLKLR